MMKYNLQVSLFVPLDVYLDIIYPGVDHATFSKYNQIHHLYNSSQVIYHLIEYWILLVERIV